MDKNNFSAADFWFGREDTPTPRQYVSESPPELTVGVSTKYDRVRIAVRYRKSGMFWQRLEARKSSRSKDAQYYIVKFPRFPIGTRVEYEVLVKPIGLRTIPERRVGEVCWFEVVDKSTEQQTSVFSKEEVESDPILKSPEVVNFSKVESLSNEKSLAFVAGTIVIPNSLNNENLTIIVEAYDKNLRNEQLLGEVLLRGAFRGAAPFEIKYSPKQFRRARKLKADLLVRAKTTNGKAAAESRIIFDAPDEVNNLRLELALVEQPPSEFELLITQLTPLLDGAKPANLTSDEMRFLADKSQKQLQNIDFWNKAAKLNRETGLPIEAGYGWQRMNVQPFTVEHLLEEVPNLLRRSLSNAIAQNIIPDISEEFDSILNRFESLRFKRGLLISQAFTVQLLEQDKNDEPLLNFAISATDLQADPNPISLGEDITDSLGEATFTVTLDGQADPLPSRKIKLDISDLDGNVITQTTITVVRGKEEVHPVRISLPEEEDTTPEVETVTSTRVSTILRQRGVRTLKELRRRGGSRRIEGLDPDDPEVKRLDAQIRLSTVSTDIDLNKELIDAGYDDVSAIAASPRSEFVSKFSPRLGDYRATLLKIRADAQYKALTNIAMGLRIELANRLLTDIDTEEEDVFPSPKCKCDECETAVSPLAYLADLLGYTVDSVRDDGKKISLGWLERNFHQPFGDIPTVCEAVDERVRQVRLCVEILWRLHKDKQSDINKLILTTADYRYQAYESMLYQIGTSREELRQVLGINDPEEIEKLANRLSIPAIHLFDLSIDVHNSSEPLIRLTLTENRLEELFGLVNTQRDPFEKGKKPLMATWREDYLRTVWKNLDWPEDAYTDKEDEMGLPIIDPDLIGPDDFRFSISGQPPLVRKPPFVLWKERRLEIDKVYQYLLNLFASSGIEAVLEEVFGLPIPGFEHLYESLTKGENLDATEEKLTKLHLSLESLKRLVELIETLAIESEKTEEDIDEFICLLVQVQKERKFFNSWRQEEIDFNIEFGPRWFWQSLREPEEGTWPPISQKGIPWIDPDLVSSDDLPEPTVGLQALKLLATRKEELEKLYKSLQAEHETNGFEALLLMTLGNPLTQELETLQTDLLSSDPATLEAAQQSIEMHLYMTVEDFNLLMLVKSKTESDNLDTQPKPSELGQVYNLLQNTYKKRILYSQWLAQEAQTIDDNGNGLDVSYWLALKARLPRWRTSSEARQTWRQALAMRSQAPLIDPDRNQITDLSAEGYRTPAYSIMNARKAWLKRKEGLLQDLQTSTTTPESAINAMFTETNKLGIPVLGVSIPDLVALSEQRTRGESITARLQQLNMSRRAFNYILGIIKQVQAGVELADYQWHDIHSIVLRIAKERLTAKWRTEEQAAELYLSYDFFRIREIEPDLLKPWRTSLQERRDWQDRLLSRIEQVKISRNALGEAVSTAEEQTLHILRDILIDNFPVPGSIEKAKAIQDDYLIDTKAGGCMLTTRVSQAIETLQGLLWGIRTNQLRDSLPKLTLDDDDFDEKWTWIGSYASWRSAMFVFIYPENVLLPTLRRWQTPAFKELVQLVRMDQRFTREKACQAAKKYEEYFHDIAQLHLDASCIARTRIYEDDTCQQPTSEYHRLFYVFVRGGLSEKAYWSAYVISDQSGHPQSFWAKVPSLEKVEKLIGAVPYAGFIYLFARINRAGKRRLLLTRFDLELNRWDDSPEEIGLPDNTVNFRVFVAQQSSKLQPPHLFLQVGQKFWHQQIEFEENQSDSDSNNVSSDEENNGWLAWEPRNFNYPYDDKNDQKTILSVVRLKSGFLVIFKHQDAVLANVPGKELYASHLLWKNLNYQTDTINFEIPNITEIKLLTEKYDSEKFRGVVARIPENIRYVSVFFQLSDGIKYFTHQINDDFFNHIGFTGGQTTQAKASFLGGEGYLAHHCSDDSGDLKGSQHHFAIRYIPGIADFSSFIEYWANAILKRQLYLSTFENAGSIAAPKLKQKKRKPLAPIIGKALTITETLSESNLNRRKEVIQATFDLNKSYRSGLISYLEEAYYFVPIYLALQLQKRGQYLAALDWFRTVYRYYAPQHQRKIYYGLIQEESLNQGLKRDNDWLLDPLNPHAIASTRRNTYTRFTLLSIIRCLLDFADAEYILDNAESVPRAREIYQTALELLSSKDLGQRENKCEELIGSIQIEIGDPSYAREMEFAISKLNDFKQANQLRPVVKRIHQILEAPNLEDEVRISRVLDTIDSAKAEIPKALTVREIVDRRKVKIADINTALLANPEIIHAITVAVDVAEANFNHAVTTASGFSLEQLRKGQKVSWLWNRAMLDSRDNGNNVTSSSPRRPALLPQDDQITNNPNKDIVPAPSYEFCIPTNPVRDMLLQRAEINLLKIRTCRNIAGLKRQLDPYAAPTDAISGLPIASDGQIILPGQTGFRPTSYRYSILIERAKQLVQLASQTEDAMLSAIEKQDAELYNLLKARQDIQLTRAGIRLQDLRQKEAESGVDLAKLQRDRAQFQVDTYTEWIEADLNLFENKMIEAYREAGNAEKNAYKFQNIFSGVQAAAIAFQGGEKWSIGQRAVAAAIAVGALKSQGIYGLKAIEARSSAQLNSLWASFERREQQWKFEKALSQKDVDIGNKQIQIAEEGVNIVKQERRIAEIQAQHAADILEFLNNKFTNAALYDWMSDVLEDIYGYFLHQATSMAKLAEVQLAFERQATLPAFIQDDYWESPDENSGIAGISIGSSPDRRGLTGSTRLLQDITQLDQYAFETDQLKLQLSTTISLARLAPIEFQQLKETGVIIFATPMEMFDRQFPGHYLRLVKRVRTSVIALIPATESIHATFTAAGNSRVVVQAGGIFQTVVINDGNHRSVALSSPIDASGVFELNQQSEMLLPFENMGVDSIWEFRMPKPANRFDYSTIADVLITIDYTALNSYDYRQQVIQQLDPRISGDLAFSFRNQFADAWYDLNNPDQTATPMVVRFQTQRADFPPNIDNLKIQHVVLYFVRKNEENFEIPVNHLQFTEHNGIGTVGGAAQSIDGIISTRRGNAGSWTAMIGKSPFGQWELAFPDEPGDVLDDGRRVRDLFQDELIENILFVITYQGTTPEWPS